MVSRAVDPRKMAVDISLNELEEALRKSEYQLQIQISKREAGELRLQEQIKNMATGINQKFDQLCDAIATIQLQLFPFTDPQSQFQPPPSFPSPLFSPFSTKLSVATPIDAPLPNSLSTPVSEFNHYQTQFQPLEQKSNTTSILMFDYKDVDGYEDVQHNSKLYLTPCCKDLVKNLNSDLTVMKKKLEVGVEEIVGDDVLIKCGMGKELGNSVVATCFSRNMFNIFDAWKVFDKMSMKESAVKQVKEMCLDDDNSSRMGLDITARPVPKPPPKSVFYREIYVRLSEQSMTMAFKLSLFSSTLPLSHPEICPHSSKLPALFKEIQESPMDINAIVAKRRGEFTNSFFRHLTLLSEIYDSLDDRDAVARLGTRCLSAVSAFDNTLEIVGTLDIAQAKFDGIWNSLSIDASCEKIKSLAKAMQLNSSLILLINGSWAAAKELATMKNEVKDIMYCIYKATQSSLRSIVPREIKLLKYLLNITDPEERFSALTTAFSPGDEHAKQSDAIYTTSKELHKWIKIMLDAYHLNKEDTEIKEAEVFRHLHEIFGMKFSVEEMPSQLLRNLVSIVSHKCGEKATKKLREAAQCCRQALALNPCLVDVHSNLGNLMKAQGLVQEAYNCYLDALGIQPTFVIEWSKLAGLFMEAGDLNRVLQYDKEAVKFKPNFSDAYLNLGNVYKALGMPQQAIVCYQIALHSRPDSAMAFGNLASVYYEQSNLDLAILNYKRVIACDDGFLEAYNNLGNALKDAGRVNEAILDYLRAIAIRPTMAEARANLASVYKDSGHVEAVIKSYRQSLTLHPEFPEAICNLLHTLQCVRDWEDRNKMFVEVEVLLRRLIKISVIPSVQPFHAFLVDVLLFEEGNMSMLVRPPPKPPPQFQHMSLEDKTLSRGEYCHERSGWGKEKEARAVMAKGSAFKIVAMAGAQTDLGIDAAEKGRVAFEMGESLMGKASQDLAVGTE